MGFKKEFRSGVEDARFATLHTLLAFLIPVGIVLALGAVILKPFGVGWGVVDRVVNPDAIVTNYEWYEQQYQDIQAIDGQLDDAKAAVTRFKKEAGPRDKWTFDDRQEASRLASVVDGLAQERKSRIATYNARSRMITRNLWKPRGDLPHQIPLD